ncbi:MAG: DUF3303 domain-containing protein [Gramella sp.]|nr:DUF3303 domain-containing protein [Christiangramia sp.]
MMTWRIHEDQRHEALKGFSAMTKEQDKADYGDKIKLIGRRHDLAGFTGFAVFESDDPHALANWALNCNQILDAVVVPVLDDDETRQLGKERSDNS